MDRSAFFTALRARDSGVFGTSLSADQVRGTEALLDACLGYPLAHVAHVLAEVYHETGGGMMPVKETVYRSSKDRNPSDATVKARLETAWARKQLPWVKTPYWRDGWFGRGQIQLTHQDNYRKASALVGVDLMAHPERALELPVSAQIAAEGCRAGMFRSVKLSDFDGPEYDHYNARGIVNGDKGKNSTLIATYGRAFERALATGDWRMIVQPSPDVEPPLPVIVPQPVTPGFLRNFFDLFTSLFRRH